MFISTHTSQKKNWLFLFSVTFNSVIFFFLIPQFKTFWELKNQAQDYKFEQASLKPVSKIQADICLLTSVYTLSSALSLTLCILLAEMSVLDNSMAMVIGPTPPGTGVIAEAIFDASS